MSQAIIAEPLAKQAEVTYLCQPRDHGCEFQERRGNPWVDRVRPADHQSHQSPFDSFQSAYRAV